MFKEAINHNQLSKNKKYIEKERVYGLMKDRIAAKTKNNCCYIIVNTFQFKMRYIKILCERPEIVDKCT